MIARAVGVEPPGRGLPPGRREDAFLELYRSGANVRFLGPALDRDLPIIGAALAHAAGRPLVQPAAAASGARENWGRVARARARRRASW